MKEVEKTLDLLENGTEQEKKAAKVVSLLNAKPVDYGYIGYSFEDGGISLLVNEDVFLNSSEQDRKTQLVFVAEAIQRRLNKRGEGKDHPVWAMAMALELAGAYPNLVEGQARPKDFGFEDGLTAEDYYDLVLEYNAQRGIDEDREGDVVVVKDDGLFGEVERILSL